MKATWIVVVAMVMAAMAAVIAGPAAASGETGTWTTATLSQARSYFAAAATTDQVFFGGGNYGADQHAVSDVVDIYDAPSRTWATARLSKPRWRLAAAAAGGQVLFAGGHDGTHYTDAVDIYDSASHAWTTARLSTARENLSGVAAGGLIFFAGGYNGSTGWSKVVDIYDPGTRTWATTSLSQPRDWMAAAASGGKVYFAGGHNYTSPYYYATVDIYDTATRTWSVSALSVGREMPAAAAAGDKVAVAGGCAAPGLTAAVDIYNTTSRTWSTAALSAKREAIAAAAVGGQILFAGGSSFSSLAVVDIYDTAANTWATASLSQARHLMAAATVGNQALFGGGGILGGGPSNVVDIYTLGTPVSVSVAITSPASPCATPIGTSVSLAATAATDRPGGSISKVEFFDGSALLGSGTAGGGGWTYTWDTHGAAVGLHNITARATDSGGAAGVSAPATVVRLLGPPTVAITCPTVPYTVIAGTPFSLMATASMANPGGSIAGVEFYDGPVLLGSAKLSGSTWTYDWDTTGVALGAHSITAKATDNLGLTAVSSSRAITVIAPSPPTVSIVSPSSGSIASTSVPLTLLATAIANEPNGSIVSVEFFDGPTKLGDGGFGPSAIWAYSWDTSAAALGAHEITVKATDNMGLTAVSSPPTTINLVAGALPTVSITSPENGYVAARGSPVSFVATASAGEPGGSIVSVEFIEWPMLCGGLNVPIKLGDAILAGGVWTYIWDTSGVAPGGHSIGARATDNLGLVVESWPCGIFVDSPPAVQVRTPASGSVCTPGATLNLTATVTAGWIGATVTGVDFYDGATKLAAATYSGAGWTYAWNTDGATPGSHVITAKSTDDFGLIGVSAPCTVIVDAPPTVQITSPVSGIVCMPGATVTLTATASDVDGTVTGVEFYDGVMKLAAATLSGDVWTCAWNTGGAMAGAHNITAKATDNRGLAASSAQIIVNVTGIISGVTYTGAQDGTNWYVWAQDTSLTDNDGFSAIDFKVCDVQEQTSANKSPYVPDYWGDRTGLLCGVFGFNQEHSSNLIAPNTLEIICGMNPGDAATQYAVRHIGQQTMVIIANNDDGTIKETSLSCPVLVAKGLMQPGLIPAFTRTPGANLWRAGENQTLILPTANIHEANVDAARRFLGVPPDMIPVVTITSPTSTYVTQAGGTVALVATASTPNPGCCITGLDFYVDGVKLHSGTSAGQGVYTYTWHTSGAATGLHAVTAKAANSFGLTGTSAPPVQVLIDTPPTVALTAPASGFVCGRNTTVSLSATAADVDGTVVRVEFYDGSVKLGDGVLSGGVWTCAWDTTDASIGLHNITAKATDNWGLTAVSMGTGNIEPFAAAADDGVPALTVDIRAPGDGDGDGSIDGLDYNVWQNGYNQPNATFLDGDYNGDGSVDGLDYNLWQNNYGKTFQAASDDFGSATADAPTTATSSSTSVSLPAAMPVAAAVSVTYGTASSPHLVAVKVAARNLEVAAQDQKRQDNSAGVTSLAIVFDCAVQAGAGAVEVYGAATGENREFVQAYDDATRTLTLTWTKALAPDVYAVRVIADFVTGADGGAPLDGETGDPAAPTLPSGDGTPGGDARLELTAD